LEAIGKSAMQANRRKSVQRSIAYGATVIAPDGSWSRQCKVVDVSQTGARLALDQAADLPADFVLALSQRGKPIRHCRVVWTAENQMGVEFQGATKRGAAA
jgi:hypothetical protein